MIQNKKKTKNEGGKITEWFDKKYTSKLIAKYNLSMCKWKKIKIEPTAIKESSKQEVENKTKGFLGKNKVMYEKNEK